MGGWGSKEDEDKTPEAVTTAAPVALFNCTYEDNGSHTYEATIREQNSTEILCQSILNVTDVKDKIATLEQKILLCNHLGSIVCKNCTTDSSYTDRAEDIEFSCMIEQTTTELPTTLVSTQEEEQTTTVTRTQEQTSLVVTESETTVGSSEIGGLDTIIILIVLGIVLLLVVLIAAIYFRRRRNQAKASSKQEDAEKVVRVQADASGELYTVVSKAINREKQAPVNGNGVARESGQEENGAINREDQAADNGFYDVAGEVGQEENRDVYAKVSMKEQRKDVKEDDVYNVLFENNATNTSNDLYSVAASRH